MDGEQFKVVGVDLGAQPKDTAYCVIAVDESQGTFIIESPKSGQEATDDKLLEAFSGKARIGIDAPFGWPVEFVATMLVYRDGGRWPGDDPEAYPGKDSTMEYRTLKCRATDLHVWASTKKKPLSVVADLMSAVAMRAAALISRAQHESGLQVDRSGRTGRFVEVYPAAALKQWDIQTSRDIENGATKSYKKYPEARKHVLCDIRRYLENGLQDSDEYWRTDDQLDALVSALVTLMAELDRRLAPAQKTRLIKPIPPGFEAVAKMEGWIALPRTSSLRDLSARAKKLASTERS